MAKTKEVRVIMRQKSPGQRRNCITPGCPNDSVLEAFAEKDGITAQVRCCENTACQEMARELAVEVFKPL